MTPSLPIGVLGGENPCLWEVYSRWSRPLVERFRNNVSTASDDACTNLCLLPACGDGILHTGEACDDDNFDNTDGCLITCEAFDWCEEFSISSITPQIVCVTSVPDALTITGSGFAVIEGRLPEVTAP